jgi:hypothetical protein
MLGVQCSTLKCEFVRHTLAHAPDVGNNSNNFYDEKFFEFYNDQYGYYYNPNYEDEEEDYGYLYDLNIVLVNANELWLGDIGVGGGKSKLTLKICTSR